MSESVKSATCVLFMIFGGGGSGIPSSESDDDEGEADDACLGEYCGDDRLRGGAGGFVGGSYGGGGDLK